MRFKPRVAMDLNDFIQKYVSDTKDGGWSDWSSWNMCPVTCGVSMVTRSRSCDNPVPRMCGRQCLGNDQEWKTCEVLKCRGQSMENIAIYASIKVDIDGTTANKPFVFNNVITNVGGWYDSSTGVFRAPTDGLFVFSLTVRHFSHSKYGYDGHFSIKKGDNVVMKVYPDMHSRESEFDTASGTTVLELSKEDTVSVVADQGGRYIEGDEDFSTYFSGYQIG